MPPLSIRALGRRLNAAPVQEDSARARGLHPRQFAPGGGELRSRLYEPLAHVRGGGYLPGKHAAWQRRTIRAFGSWSPVGTVQDRPSRQARRSLPLVLIEPLAHVRGPVPGLSIRGGCTPGNSRLGAVSCAHACTNRWRACAPGVSPGRGRRWQKSKKRKGRGKRHWPSLFSLRGIIEEGRTCISRKGAVHFF